MCFDTTNSARAKVATKDIICYKVTQRKSKEEGIRSLYKNYLYELGVLQPLVKVRKKREGIYGASIYKGYHSYKSKNSAEWHNGAIRKCIIPKGTRYYENRSDYVSETIIMVK